MMEGLGSPGPYAVNNAGTANLCLKNKGIDKGLTKKQEAEAIWIESGLKPWFFVIPHTVICNQTQTFPRT